MTKKEALKEFREFALACIPKTDKPMWREAWNDYTDSLCKEGRITDQQYNNWTNAF
jgi:hypothetical protein